MNNLTVETDGAEQTLSIPEQVDLKLENERNAQPADVQSGSPLYAAMHAIYGKIQRLQQTALNKHGGYEFTPADDYRDRLRTLFHEHKLIDRMNEVYSSQAGEGMKSGTLKFQFEFWIIHVESGEATDKVLRSVFLPYVGSQTAGIASTFAWKEWMKNEFKISTGEADPLQSIGEADQRAGDKLSESKSEDVAAHLSDSLEELLTTKPDKEKLEDWKSENQPSIDSLHNAHFQKLKAVYLKAHKATS